jgi:hypothetical protein
MRFRVCVLFPLLVLVGVHLSVPWLIIPRFYGNGDPHEIDHFCAGGVALSISVCTFIAIFYESGLRRYFVLRSRIVDDVKTGVL